MIVVAIIGILAAVAIPGFMAYIKNSKTSEAKTNLDAIKTGAVAWYEAEHNSPDGLVSITKQYPKADSATKVGTAPSDATIGVKTSPTASGVVSALQGKPWSELNFRISAPFYYEYQYIAKATEAADKLDLSEGIPASTFNAVANASLGEKCDSTFSISGTAAGVVGAVVDKSNNGTCTDAKLPSASSSS